MISPSIVLTLGLALFSVPGISSLLPRQAKNKPWSVSNFHSLLTFGDSYTDESRLGYFIQNNGSAPPAGVLLPESNSTAGGGRTWPRYVVQYTGSTKNGEWDPSMTLYNYAVSGAVCSNKITPRYVTSSCHHHRSRLPRGGIDQKEFTRWFSAINAPFPSVLEYEIPAFQADMKAQRVNATPAEPYFTTGLSAQSALYALWIGTNDLGVWAFVTDSQIRGKVLTDYTSCVYEVFDKLYAAGGRMFVLMNTAPLHLAPLYANSTLHGVGPNQYWPNKTSNHTQISETMHEYTSTVNNVFKYQTPFELMVANRYPDAHFAVFDMYSLISDVYDNPTAYLNGTDVKAGTETVRGYINHCNVNQTVCVKMDNNGTNPDGFLWYDELHPR